MTEQQPIPNQSKGRAYLSLTTGGQWQPLDASPEASETASSRDNSQQTAQVARLEDRLKESLRTSLAAHNLVVLAGSGTSLGGAIGGPSLQDLWCRCSKLEGFEPVKATVCFPKSDDGLIENLLSRCRSYLQIFDQDQENSLRVETFLAEAEKAIATACTRFISKADLETHKTFLRRMARRRSRAPRLKVFTTNYDTCFERAAGALGIVVVDGFTFTQPRRFDPRFFSYDVVRRTDTPGSSNDFVDGVFQLLKIHGSVNWSRHPKGMILQEDDPDSPCLIFPATSKYEQSYSQPHLELMSQFLSSLRTPNTSLVVIGFGFGDSHLTAPILEALAVNPSLQLIVVDVKAHEKSEDDATTHRALVELVRRGDPRVTLVNASFAAFTELIPDLKALSSPEQLARSVRDVVGES